MFARRKNVKIFVATVDFKIIPQPLPLTSFQYLISNVVLYLLRICHFSLDFVITFNFPIVQKGFTGRENQANVWKFSNSIRS